MDLLQYRPLLEASQIFAGVSRRTLDHILAAAAVRPFEAGEFLFLQGDEALTFHLLVQGRVKQIHVTPDGHQVLVRFLGPGQEVDPTAVLSGIRYPMAVRAMENGAALTWQGEIVAQFMEAHARISFNVIRMLVVRNQELVRRYEELLTQYVEQRLAQALLRLGAQYGHDAAAGTIVDLSLTRRDLAELIGTSLYTVSRILSNWNERGIVKTRRGRLTIRRPEELRQLSTNSPL